MKKILNNMVIVLVLAITLMLVGCGSSTDAYGNSLIHDKKWFYRIGSTATVYAKDTKVMYYQDSYGHQGYMAPYYNEHGQLCRYVDGQIVPIE